MQEVYHDHQGMRVHILLSLIHISVKEGSSLAYYCSSDTEVVESVYNYIISNFKYDYDKAKNVKMCIRDRSKPGS